MKRFAIHKLVFSSMLLCLVSSTQVQAVVPKQSFARYSLGLINSLTDIDQRSLRFCSGGLYGISDSKGREILPVTYSDISYCGHGIFLAVETEPKSPFHFGTRCHFFNRDGIESPHSVPTDSALLQILTFGSEADKRSNLILDRLSSSTLLIFEEKDEKQGICDLQGRILLPAVKGRILFLNSDYALIDYGESKNCSKVDFKSFTVKPTRIRYISGKIPKPRIPESTRYHGFVNLPPPVDRIIKRVESKLDTFDIYYWVEKRVIPITPLGMFNLFLTKYDLIGMSEDRVKSLLGSPDKRIRYDSNGKQNLLVSPEIVSLNYRLEYVQCTPYLHVVRITLRNNKVICWNIHYEGKESAQVTTNVLLRLNQKGLPTVKGKHEFEFPSTIPKY